MGIALFSSLGLPGLNGFVGEFLIFRGDLVLAANDTLFTSGSLTRYSSILNDLQHYQPRQPLVQIDKQQHPTKDRERP